MKSLLRDGKQAIPRLNANPIKYISADTLGVPIKGVTDPSTVAIVLLPR
jgi:hypothetical protein